ncbi:MAG TPA: hypothetical protein VGW37_06095 [Terriglobia bacterium]|nr:hypothetical protein [Terriglobia bacterium]
MAQHRWAGLIVFSVPTLLLVWDSAGHGFPRRQGIIIILFSVLGLGCLLLMWFGQGTTVWLKGDYVAIGSGRSAKRSLYQDIQQCDVRSDVYKGVPFTVLAFSVRKGLPAGQVGEAAVPAGVEVSRVLDILREKGVRIVQGTSADCPASEQLSR